jgi:luciferase family oxidoreductase group 1
MSQQAGTSIPLSVLDLASVREGGSIAESFHNTLDLARHVEKWGYTRFWLAEHHNMSGIASAATSVMIGYVAGGTSTLRVGSGGIMLPDHAPLVIAEHFGTLEALYPGRIDLGLGRAPGSDQLTARALGRPADAGDRFPQLVQELLVFLGPVSPGQRIQATPGAGSNVPVWRRASSTRRSIFTGTSFALHRLCGNRTPWSASRSSPRTLTRRPGSWPRRPTSGSCA